MMYSVKQDFEERKSEVIEYLSFIHTLTKDMVNEEYMYNSYSNKSLVITNISSKLERILIANSFLLLYNLVEATISMSIEEIFNTITDERVSFIAVSEKIKTIWIKQQTDDLKNGATYDKLNRKVTDIAQCVLRPYIELDKDKFGFSGNLDAGVISKLADNYGFRSAQKPADKLRVIKTKRNHLAHGNFSFSDIGKDYSVDDLESFKTQTFDYLDAVIIEIEAYINDKKYLLSTS